MLLDIDSSILDAMNEGIILINYKAQVIGHNKASEAWLPLSNAAILTIRRFIAQGLVGITQFPVQVDLLQDSNAVSPLGVHTWLCKNSMLDYVIFIVSPLQPVAHLAPVAKTETTDQRFMALMGDQIRQKIAQFHALTPTEMADTALKANILQIDALLEEIANLSVLKQRDQVFSSERIDINELIRGVFNQLELTNYHEFDTVKTPQGVIYGDAIWLSYAFNVLLAALMRGLTPKGSLYVKSRQLGDFVVVSGRSVLHEPKMSEQNYPSPDASQIESPEKNETLHLAARMLMCQRICELHGGFLKMEFQPVTCDTDVARPVDSFVLTLRSGLPEHERSRVSCSECRLNLQAQAYAADIAQLLSNPAS